MNTPRPPHPSRTAAPKGDTPAAAVLSFGASHTEGAQPRTHAAGRQWPDGKRGRVAALAPRDPMARPAIEGLRKRHPLPTSAPAWETSQTLAPGGRQDKGSPEEGRATSDGPLPPPGPPCIRPLGRGGCLTGQLAPQGPGTSLPLSHALPSPTAWGQTLPRPRQSSSSHVGSTSPSAQAPVSGCRRGETPPFPPGDAGPRDAGSAEAAQPPGPSTEPATLPRPSRSQLGTRASAAEARPRAPPPHRLGDAKLGLQTGGLTVVNAGPAQRDSANRKRGGQANGQDCGQAARAVRSGDAGPELEPVAARSVTRSPPPSP